MSIKKFCFLALLSFCFFCFNASAVSVVVTDESGEPLVGATVLWKGTKSGGMTDSFGMIDLKKNDSTNVLITTCIGYKNDTTTVRDESRVNVKLKELEGGYGLKEVEVMHNVEAKPTKGAMFVEVVSRKELFRAACCNLGESFTTNPSVDVNYSDAATGAKQIKLLGLSGIYVQMLTENIPNHRGASSPFSLSYIPGPWMQSIQISKGCSSVKNGHESLTGQINVEYLKPQNDEVVNLNLFMNSHKKIELNADANYHINKSLSTGVLAHYDDMFDVSDMNDDGMIDMPKMRQLNLMNRWMYKRNRYIMQAGLKMIGENRKGGEMEKSGVSDDSLYKINVKTNRLEFFSKNAFVLDYDYNTNIALIASGSLYNQDALYGSRFYDVDEKNLYGALFFESNVKKYHSISTGYNLMYDDFEQDFNLSRKLMNGDNSNEREWTHGVYGQYTFNWREKLVAIMGARFDNSSIYGGFVTPRCHVKYAPAELFSIRLAAGSGCRSPHPLAEYHYLLASNRRFVVEEELKQEKDWNYGASATFRFNLLEKKIVLNCDYFYTDFKSQLVVDMDSDPHAVLFSNLEGKSYSHTFQIDASCSLSEQLSASAAFRFNDVKMTYNGVLRERPLMSRYKGLISVNYKTPLELWQFDVTCQLNGKGRLPKPYIDEHGESSWDNTFSAYPQLSAQIVRFFRWGSIYVGGENLTNFKQENPIVGSDNPWGDNYDATVVWGPLSGVAAYVGARIKLNLKKKNLS